MHFLQLGDNMTRKKRPNFSPEFKLESAQLVVDQNYSVRQAAEAVNVSASSMDKWSRQLREERNGTSSMPNALTPDQRKIQELEKRIKRIETEKEILKKATALLMSDSLNNLR
jgi:transposase